MFWGWLVQALYHGLIVYWLVMTGFVGSNDYTGVTFDHWYKSSMLFSCIIHLVTLKLVLETINVNIIYLVAGLVSLGCYWVMANIFSIYFIA